MIKAFHHYFVLDIKFTTGLFVILQTGFKQKSVTTSSHNKSLNVFVSRNKIFHISTIFYGICPETIFLFTFRVFFSFVLQHCITTNTPLRLLLAVTIVFVLDCRQLTEFLRLSSINLTTESQNFHLTITVTD